MSTSPATGTRDLLAEYGLGHLVRPFSARSLVASTLLGTHPPRLPGRLLVAFAHQFGIAPGTTRVALSRMVAAGELTVDQGSYRLTGALLDRQGRQDRGRQGDTPAWDGGWEQAVITSTGRPSNQRARTRRDLTELGLGELREGVWLRPANLDPGRSPAARTRLADQVRWFAISTLDEDKARSLAASVFDLDAWAADAHRLITACDQAHRLLSPMTASGTDPAPTGQAGSTVAGFTLAAATLRHFVHDPLLPPALHPPGWPAADLRAAYDLVDEALSARLRAFFAQAKIAPDLAEV